MDKKIKVKEIFTSIQGEGPYIGYKQLFIRLCGCNLKCNYCDTDFVPDSGVQEYTVIELLDEIKKYKDVHSVSFTGGEPLLHYQFLAELFPQINKKIYLETNATLYDELKEVIDYVDIISADIKLPSCSGQDNFEAHEKFFNSLRLYELDCACDKQFDCYNHECFVKIVFGEAISDEEIEISAQMAKRHDLEIILQPMMLGNNLSVTSEKIEEVFDKFLSHYERVRVIPQVHKFIAVR